jgi:hypothetical protein
MAASSGSGREGGRGRRGGNNERRFEVTRYNPRVIDKITHDHQEVLKKNAERERRLADKNLKEMGTYYAMADKFEYLPIPGLKMVTAFRSQHIESKKVDWQKYDHTKFGTCPLTRYKRPDVIDLTEYKYLQSVSSTLSDHIMPWIKERKPIEFGKEGEWMIDLCRQLDPVLSYITAPEEFTISEFPSLIFTGYPFEIPYEDHAKLYVVLVKGEKIAGYLVIDFFFYYF